MAEYIDLDTPLEIYVDRGGFYRQQITTLRELLDVNHLRYEIADVRPVVLCRDCDCWNDWDSAGRESLGNYVCSCAYWTVEDGAVFYTRPTDFCSYGERREE